MKSDRRPRWRGPGWAVSLIIALAAAMSVAPVSVASVPERAPLQTNGSATVPTRIEGLLKWVENTWLVDNTRIEVTPQTGINEKRGEFEPGAWVAAWGDKAEDRLIANVVEVLRPKGAPPPPVQFSGVLTKLTKTYALVSNMQVQRTEQTSIPVTPPLYSLVRVTGYRTGNSNTVVAQIIEILALNANSVPVLVEGAVEQVTDATIVVDGHTLRLRPEDVGRVHQGDWVQAQALAEPDGTLVTQMIRVVDRSLDAKLDGYVASISDREEDNQTWTVVTFEGGRPENRRVLVAPDTYIDEDRASIQPFTEATVDGSKLNSVDVQADTIRLDQPAPTQQAGRLTEGMDGSMWRLDDQPVYFPSEETKGIARSARAAQGDELVVVSGARLRNGVLIAKEVRPATATDATLLSERTRAAASSVAWVGPTSVVSDVQTAAAPTLLLGADRTAHLVYESNGFVYYMSRPEGHGWSGAGRLAKGLSPTAVLDARGNLHVAYVNTFLGKSDIFHVRTVGGQWTLPVLVSATTGSSDDPALAADKSGGVYVAWMDNTSGGWAIHTGQWDGTYWINYPVPNARGGSPSLAVLPEGNLFLAWQDRVPTPTDSWGILNIYGAEQAGGKWDLPVNISDNAEYSPGAESLGVTLVAAPDGNAHLAWIDDYQQPRYDFGRGLYWPAPVALGPRQAYANGLNMQLGANNTLRVSWDDKTGPLLTAAPIGAQSWPAAESLPGLSGTTYGASLALSGNGMALAWLQEPTKDARAIYEAHIGIAGPMLKYWLPLMVNQN